ncbi:glycosyltransferase family 2 protein [Sphingobacterium lactis]|uniref:glycosyltransferase family 2 protein n=2 Tax=Pseudomonadati TaxID=3379134 RepID=UPI003F7EAF70
MKYRVSVIIPMYKVEAFVGKCATQLFTQSLTDLQYIFIDDCSPDNSSLVVKEVLKEFPIREKDVKIIRHEFNKGLPSARNTGLTHAEGEFIFHCDGDDWLETDALELLYNKAITDQSEIVFCDWYLSFKNNERYMTQDPGNVQMDGFHIMKLMLSGKLKYNVWNKLVKRDLYFKNSISFPDGYGMGEDMTMIKLFSYANKISYLPKALYHYVQMNNEAFTKKPSDSHFDQIKYNASEIEQFLQTKFPNLIKEELAYFKLNIKLPFLISSDRKSYDRWNAWYPEANPYIDKNSEFNTRIKFIQKAALNKQYWKVKMHYHLIIRLVYGIIYR